MGYIFVFYVDGSFTVRMEYLSPCQFRCAVSLEMLFNRYEPNHACGSLFCVSCIGAVLCNISNLPVRGYGSLLEHIVYGLRTSAQS
jgi:hypothetical protein